MNQNKYVVKWRAKDGTQKSIWCDTKQEMLAEVDDKMCISDSVTVKRVKKAD